ELDVVETGAADALVSLPPCRAVIVAAQQDAIKRWRRRVNIAGGKDAYAGGLYGGQFEIYRAWVLLGTSEAGGVDIVVGAVERNEYGFTRVLEHRWTGRGGRNRRCGGLV